MTDADGPAGTDRLWLADWRRRVAALYAAVRDEARHDPERAWRTWRDEREALYCTHPQSPLPAPERARFALRTWPYDDRWRASVALEPDDGGARPSASPLAAAPLALPNSGSESPAFDRIGVVRLPWPGVDAPLPVFWMRGYAGGLFLPFGDATNGTETYGAGRYLLDTAKGADLGGDPDDGTLVVDANFAFHPSCAWDPRWACPLAPPESRVRSRVEAGERLR